MGRGRSIPVPRRDLDALLRELRVYIQTFDPDDDGRTWWRIGWLDAVVGGAVVELADRGTFSPAVLRQALRDGLTRTGGRAGGGS